jgi:hypothetical protein
LTLYLCFRLFSPNLQLQGPERTKLHFNHDGEDADQRTVSQRITDELCQSIPVTVFVIFLVVLALLMEQTGSSNPIFSMFVSIFFVFEISIRYYAKGFSLFIRDPFCVMDFLITVIDIVGVIMELVLGGGGTKAEDTIAMLNMLRLLRIIRMARLCKLLLDVFRQKRSGMVEDRAKRIKEAHRNFRKGEYTIKDPEKEEHDTLIAPMSVYMRAYQMQRNRHYANNQWVSREAGEKFGKAHAMPRRVKTFEGNYRKKLYGEESEGELYSLRHTTVGEISEHFGLSIGLYFNTLYFCMVFFVLLFVASSPAVANNIIQTEESASEAVGTTVTVPTNLIGTAVCMTNKTVMLPGGVEHYRPDCEATSAHIAAAFLVLFMLFYFLKSYASFVARVIQEIDDKVISAQDFGVEVMDPDEDAYDPSEWYHFLRKVRIVYFEYSTGRQNYAHAYFLLALKYGRVVSITITLDNGQLLQALSELFEIDHVLQQLPLDEDEEKEGGAAILANTGKRGSNDSVMQGLTGEDARTRTYMLTGQEMRHVKVRSVVNDDTLIHCSCIHAAHGFKTPNCSK